MTDRPHILALDHIASIEDPIRVTDDSGNPHLHYSAQHVKAAFLAGAAAQTTPATGEKRNAHDDAAVYGIGIEVDGVAIHPGRVVIRKRQSPATGHAATEGEGA